MLHIGQPFPDFTLPNQDGQMKTKKHYEGKWMVVFVYPKDDTPGCTIESKAFSAAKAEFSKIGAVAIGLSEDDVGSHEKFCKKYGLETEMLSDTKAALLKALGVGQSEWKGTMFWDRTSFLVDPQGVIRKIYVKVKPEGHEQEVLKDIQTLAHSGK